MKVLTDARGNHKPVVCAVGKQLLCCTGHSRRLSLYPPYQKELRDVLRGMNRTRKISTHESGKHLFNNSELCFILVFPIRNNKIVFSFANIRIII